MSCCGTHSQLLCASEAQPLVYFCLHLQWRIIWKGTWIFSWLPQYWCINMLQKIIGGEGDISLMWKGDGKKGEKDAYLQTGLILTTKVSSGSTRNHVQALKWSSVIKPSRTPGINQSVLFFENVHLSNWVYVCMQCAEGLKSRHVIYTFLEKKCCSH